MAERSFMDRLREFRDGVARSNYVFWLRVENYLKTDKITDALGIKWHNPEFELEMIKDRPERLQYIKDQTKDLCFAAVEKSADAMQYVNNQTEDICIKAVQKDYHSLQYINDKTPDICAAACLFSSSALQYVEDTNLCLDVFDELGEIGFFSQDLLKYVREQTPEICMAAVQHNGYSLVYAEQQTPELCMAAVQTDGGALMYVQEQSPELCMAAVRQDGLALKYVEEQTPEICLAAIKQNPDALGLITNPTPEMIQLASKDMVSDISKPTMKEMFEQEPKKNHNWLDELIGAAESKKADIGSGKKEPVRQEIFAL